MEIDVRYNSRVNITFHGAAKVNVRGDHNYLVKWFENNEFIGEMYLNSGTWGAYPMNDISSWRIEFWYEGDLIYSYNNSLINNPILIICENNGLDFKDFVSSVRSYVNDIVDRHQAKTFVYFKGSELCDFTQDNFTPLRLNDKIDSFKIIHTKNF
jgi:hypothetical protein